MMFVFAFIQLMENM